MDTDVRAIRAGLESHTIAPEAALERLAEIARDAPIRAVRIDAFRELGDIAGRAFDSPWEVAERAAWALLDVARHADSMTERCGLLLAMGRGFRNLWLMPYVHGRLADTEPDIVAAAITASGGLGFAGLEEAVASRFLGEAVEPALRRSAIAALGRMGALSAADRLVALITDERPAETAAVLSALTEIRSGAGIERAMTALDRDPPRDVLIAATRYLAEIGHEPVLRTMRRLARDDDAELRIMAGMAARAYKAERTADATERILAALTERDRAVRAVLARRLRTRPITEVLAQAELLLGDDPEGVVQILAEVRTPEVTRYLLGLSVKTELPLHVRSRAVGSVEANEEWERDELTKIALESDDRPVRAAAVQAMGAFATTSEIFRRIGGLLDDTSPVLRGAFLWALQLSAGGSELSRDDRTRCVSAIRKALADTDPDVRRRAAYVAGNLDLESVADALVALARSEERSSDDDAAAAAPLSAQAGGVPSVPPTRAKGADIRTAALVSLGEIAVAARFDDMVNLFVREDHPQTLAAASRALTSTLLANPDASLSLEKLQARLEKLLASPDAMVRASAARLAGRAGATVTPAALLKLASDSHPRVHEEVLSALGRVGSPEAQSALLGAMDDVDPAIHERAADALLSLGTNASIARLLTYVTAEEDPRARGRIAARIAIPQSEAEHYLPMVNAALGRIDAHDPAYDPLLDLKVTLLESRRPDVSDAGTGVDAAIVAAFPMFAQLSKVRGFEPLGRSLRTAEALYRSAPGVDNADLSPAIVMWMKCLEGYMQAWLSPRLQAMQQEPHPLYDQVDRLLGSAWPQYQRFLSERWADPVAFGAISVDVPLRSIGNVLRDFQDRRTRRLDVPLSVTEWSRLMLFFAVDHPSGTRNMFKVANHDADHVARLAHRLHSLAAVRNAVTHRTVAGSSTLEAFRRTYYKSFEELTRLA